jgi:hypothetical protein
MASHKEPPTSNRISTPVKAALPLSLYRYPELYTPGEPKPGKREPFFGEGALELVRTSQRMLFCMLLWVLFEVITWVSLFIVAAGIFFAGSLLVDFLESIFR